MEDMDTDLISREEPTDDERWKEWAMIENICRICGSSREVCGGEEKHG